MIKPKEGKEMKYFWMSFLSCSMFVNAGICAYLPVVDVSNGTVSARAIFGEEIAPKKSVSIEPLPKKVEKKVVSRTAAKSVPVAAVSSVDILNPHRPSSDLWARSADAPLRMPRMDEISVINSDALLPEESIETKTIQIARDTTPRVTHDETLDEIKKLRAEVARLANAQKQSDEKIARARAVSVRTPVSGASAVKPAIKADTVVEPAVKKSGEISVRREIVNIKDMDENIARNASIKIAEPKLTSVNEMSKMSPNELKKAFKKTYLSENKHLSTYQMDDRYDEVSDMSSAIEGFSASRDLSEMNSGVRPLEIKISFLNGDSGLSRENYNLLSESASIVVNNPKRAVQIAIPESATQNKDARKLASRRLAIIEQVLRDTGVADQRIVPVLSQRDDDVFVLRIISGDTFETLNQQKRNMFGDSISQKTYKSMSW